MAIPKALCASALVTTSLASIIATPSMGSARLLQLSLTFCNLLQSSCEGASLLPGFSKTVATASLV